MTGDELEVFEAERARLHALAYRMLSSVADADDVVQETWLRWERLGHDGRSGVDRPAAWLTTTASRIALDVLKSARRQREEYVGPWLPEPLLTGTGSGRFAGEFASGRSGQGDPAAAIEWAESLTLGFLVVLERLSPVERAVFLLADVFGEPYSAIASVVDRSEDACRQIATRARQRVRDEHRRVAPVAGAVSATELVQRFLAACAFGQVDDLRDLLHDDVVLVSDGGRSVHAARRPVVGIDRVSRFLVNVTGRLTGDVAVDVREVNGEPGLVVSRGGDVTMVMAFEVDGGRIGALRLLLNPDKLRRVAVH